MVFTCRGFSPAGFSDSGLIQSNYSGIIFILKLFTEGSKYAQ
jgi:hypothetical protein